MLKIRFDEVKKDPEAGKRVAEILARGGVVIFPTETVYGLGVQWGHEQGLAKLRELSGLKPEATVAVHLSREDAIKRLENYPANVQRLAKRVYPGPVTLKFNDGMGMVRVPDDPAAQWLIGVAGGQLAGASAKTGDPEELEALWAGKADAVILNGKSRFSKPSTLVDVKVEDPSRPAVVTVAREGVYDARYMAKFLKFTVLMVCSGNTCRSPMAAALGRAMVATKLGVTEAQLEARGIKIISAGTMAATGYTASENAVEVMQRKGIDLTRHRSSPLTHEMVNEADLILCMTRSHMAQLGRFAPSALEKAKLMDMSKEIDDPYGGPVEAYEETADQMEPAIRKHLEREGWA